jgi:hypothetical protein
VVGSQRNLEDAFVKAVKEGAVFRKGKGSSGKDEYEDEDLLLGGTSG